MVPRRLDVTTFDAEYFNTTSGTKSEYLLGEQAPLELSSNSRYAVLHHYHLVALGPKHLEQDLKTAKRDELLAELDTDVQNP